MTRIKSHSWNTLYANFFEHIAETVSYLVRDISIFKYIPPIYARTWELCFTIWQIYISYQDKLKSSVLIWWCSGCSGVANTIIGIIFIRTKRCAIVAVYVFYPDSQCLSGNDWPGLLSYLGIINLVNSLTPRSQLKVYKNKT